jgi:hypothetical protein
MEPMQKAERPQSHQAIADKYNLNMSDPFTPFTRCFVAALYWQEMAAYWKQQANKHSEKA